MNASCTASSCRAAFDGLYFRIFRENAQVKTAGDGGAVRPAPCSSRTGPGRSSRARRTGRSASRSTSTRLSCGATCADTASPFSRKRISRLIVFCIAMKTASGFSGSDGEAHADRVVDGVGDRRRDAEGGGLADALAAERAAALLGVHRLVHHARRQVEEAGDLVLGERGVAQLALGVELHLLRQREAELHDRRAGELRLDDAAG